MKFDIDFVTKIFALIGAAYVVFDRPVKWYRYFKKKRRTRIDRIDRFFSGNWDNQGQIKNVPTHYIDMCSHASGRRFNGSFNVRKGDDDKSWEMFTISGKKHYKKISCEIFRTVDGEQQLVGTGLLKEDNGNLRWVLNGNMSNLFPREAVLRRGLPKVG